MEADIDGCLEVHEMILTTTGVRLIVPPSRVRDVQKLLSLEGSGFIPSNAIHYDPDERAYVLELDGEGASHLLDLLMIAVDDREAETWAERQDRTRMQLRLGLDQERPD